MYEYCLCNLQIDKVELETNLFLKVALQPGPNYVSYSLIYLLIQIFKLLF